jgi:hypothetical protein
MPMVSVPNQAAYGYFPQALATSMTQENYDPVDRIALLKRSHGAMDAYTAAIQHAQQAEMAMQQDANHSALASSYLNAVPNMANSGISRGVELRDNPYLSSNRDVLTQADLIHSNKTEAESEKDRSEVVKNINQSGHDSGPYLQQALGGSVGKPVPTTPYVTPEDQARLEAAKAQELSAEASMYHAKHGGNPNGGDLRIVNGIVNPKTGEEIPISVQTKSHTGVQADPTKGGVQAPGHSGGIRYIPGPDGRIIAVPN